MLRIIWVFSCYSALCGSALAASPGLPFTEDFSNQSLMATSNSSARWSTEEQAVYLQWRDHLRAGQISFPTSGADLDIDADDSSAIAIGDVDGDGDLDLVVGNLFAVLRNGINLMAYIGHASRLPPLAMAIFVL